MQRTEPVPAPLNNTRDDALLNQQQEQQRHFWHNLIVNVIDGGFFGMAILGFSSTTTVLPLYLNTLTDSTILIGLIGSLGIVGWRLPQLLTARRVAGLSHYKPFTIRMTFHERFPFFLMAAVALFTVGMPAWAAIALTFLFFTWHAVGGGLTATAWQSMIGRIMPDSRRGTFYGIQSAAFSTFGAGGAFLSGWLLIALPYPTNFAVCFALAGVTTFISWGFLALTREPAPVSAPPPVETSYRVYWRNLMNLLVHDTNFRWFVAALALSQFALLGERYYTLYATREFALTPDVIGTMTGLFALVQIPFNMLAGALGDRFGHRLMLSIGVLALVIANVIALVAQDATWLYVVWIFAGAGGAILFTSTLAIILTFGDIHQRPYYIGLGNTLIAPSALIAPFIGGALVDAINFDAMFIFIIVSAVGALLLLRRSAAAPSDGAEDQRAAGG
jgi:MFS family permease